MNMIKPTLIFPSVFRNPLENYCNESITKFWDVMNCVCSPIGDQRNEPNGSILALASSLIKSGFEPDVCDFNVISCKKYPENPSMFSIEDYDHFFDTENFKDKLLCLSIITANEPQARYCAQLLRKKGNRLPIIVGGQFPTLYHLHFTSESWKDFCNVIIIGEGDNILCLIAEIINQYKSKPPKILNQILLKKLQENKDYQVHINQFNQLIIEVVTPPDISQLPSPSYELIRLKPNDLIYRIWTTRGCGEDCIFCTPAICYRRSVRYRSIEKVKEDIQKGIEIGAQYFAFGDLTFFYDEDHSREILKMVKTNFSTELNFWCQTRIDRITDPNIDLLKESGCSQIAIGIETFHESSLKKVSKHQCSKTIITALECIKNFGLSTEGYVVIGLPEETVESTFESIRVIHDLLRENLLTVINPSIFVPFPGLKVPDSVEIINKNYNNYVMNVFHDHCAFPVYRTDKMSAYEIRALWEFLLAGAIEAVEKRKWEISTSSLTKEANCD